MAGSVAVVVPYRDDGGENQGVCGSCWVSMGQPVVWDEDVAEAVRLLSRLYELCPTGGPLHVVVDDWNIDGYDITPMYKIPARGVYPGHPDNYSAEVHDICDRLASMLSEMPVGWRGSVLAHQEGLAVEGAVAADQQQWGLTPATP